jgi:hypothetical protein
MNNRQKEVLLVAGLLIVLMILFPPWEYFDNDSSARSPAGYHLLLKPPALKSVQEMFGVPKLRVPNQVHVELDIFRLAFQLIVIIPIAAGLFLLLADTHTLIKRTFGVFLIGGGLFVLGYALWLEHFAASDLGGLPKQNEAAHAATRQKLTPGL